MKKFVLGLLLVLTAGLFSCKQNDLNEVHIYLPDGTPALAMASVLDKGFVYEETTTYFHLVQASEIAARISQQDCDLAIAPMTVASTLFNKGIDIQLASVNVFGNLFIAGTRELKRLEDLKGKVVYTTVGTTIDMLKYLLEQNEIEYAFGAEAEEGKVTLSSKNDGSEIIPLLKAAANKNQEAYGVLGEPQVTKATQLIDNLVISFDLQEEYRKITGFDGYPQAGLVVKSEFASDHSAYLQALLSALLSNETYLLENTESLPEVFKRYNSSLQAMTFTTDTIRRCTIRLEESKNIKEEVQTYLSALTGNTVADSFFWTVKK